MSDDVDNIRKDVATIEGDNVKVDLDGLIRDISKFLEPIKIRWNTIFHVTQS